MTVTDLRPPAPPPVVLFTGIHQTPPAAVRDAVLEHLLPVFADAPVAVPVSAVCQAAAENATNAVESLLASTLLSVAWADSTTISRAVEDIEHAHTSLQRHEQTSGHDECCGDNCETCVPGRPGAGRCDTCQAIPHERLDFAISALLDIPAQRLTARVHDQLFTAAAAAAISESFAARCSTCPFQPRGGWVDVTVAARHHQDHEHHVEVTPDGATAQPVPRAMWAGNR